MTARIQQNRLLLQDASGVTKHVLADGEMNFTLDSLKIGSLGTSISEITTTMATNSDNKVPTEKAVKDYITATPATIPVPLNLTLAGTQLNLLNDALNSTSFTTSAAGDLTIAPSGGDSTFTGTLNHSDVWKELQLATVARPGGATPPTLTVYGTYYLAYFFSGGGANYLYGSIDMPHDIKTNSAFDFHVHWAPSTAGAGSVVWTFDYSFTENGNVIGAPASPAVTSPAAGVAYTNTLAVLTTGTYTIATKSPILNFRLWRNTGSPSDDYADNAILLGVSMHYKTSSRGDLA